MLTKSRNALTHRSWLAALMGWALLATLPACLSQGDSDHVPYEPPAEEPDTDEPVVSEPTYDTEPDPNDSFDYNLDGLPYKGVNVSSAEWGMQTHKVSDEMPGFHGSTYYWPDPLYRKGYNATKKFMEMGMNLLRVPFAWERIQHELGKPLIESELEAMKLTVFHMLSEGATVILDMHNYGRYTKVTIDDDRMYVRELLVFGDNLSPEDFGDVWGRIAEVFRDHPRVFFGLMNEPHDLPTTAWVEAANAAIHAIRGVGARNLILVGGNLWSGAHSWNANWGASDGISNAEGMLDIDDSEGNVVFEVHQYANHNFSGWDGGCQDETIGSRMMKVFTQWLRDNNKRGFLGEFGVLDDAVCQACLRDHLQYLEDNGDVYIGWTYWAASPLCPGWARPVDPFCYKETPVQMQILQEFL
ncbi:MAG: glycoside hydrolase family 5 protein [Myxococcales bacterium]|jgi:endoglucanase|nr:glycoside hydrolase family 5 protein [Myxococcales bacterium]